MTYINPNAVIIGENFTLRQCEPNLEFALKTRCLHRFGPWRPFARGARRWCLDCKGAEVAVPSSWFRGRRFPSEVKFYSTGSSCARLGDFDPAERERNHLPEKWGGDACQ